MEAYQSLHFKLAAVSVIDRLAMMGLYHQRLHAGNVIASMLKGVSPATAYANPGSLNTEARKFDGIVAQTLIGFARTEKRSHLALTLAAFEWARDVFITHPVREAAKCEHRTRQRKSAFDLETYDAPLWSLNLLLYLTR
jgi:hypothetical protein